jgi:hypothetical protein
MKKKIVAVLVILALFSTSVFAAPLSVTASFSEPVQTVVSSEQTQEAPEAFSAIDETGDLFADTLFADVGGIPLTTTEAGQVEGGGIVPLIILCVAVAVLVASSSTSGGR